METPPPFIREGEGLASHVRFRVGGPADFFCVAHDLDMLQEAVTFAKNKHIPSFILGEGSNLVVQDGGIRGIVIRLGKGFKEIRIEGEKLYAGCAAKLPRVCHHAARKGLQGLEGLVGIPGTVGGAVIMNAGAGESAACNALESLTVLEKGGGVRKLGREDFLFSYRKFQWVDGTPLHERILLEACWRLQPASSALLTETIKKALALRKKTQPIAAASAGCVFKNPGSQTSAGRLIDEAGLKGMSIGDAVISQQHANFIVNKGNACARDILALMAQVEKTILHTHGISLEREVCVVGETDCK
ncbi:UDP-N-acetylmuramate dehydrogenase [Desulfococcaceae bacterium OttesenSCG-928-F15]|nr:UDP-N-acetylmuramate dehydrogenase [Desulfococcaceae bacterium OttesenSCG-928-F15]